MDYNPVMEPLVLVVEDSEIDRLLLMKILEKNGISSKWVGTGQECMVEIERNLPDLILLDIMMPQMNGLETLKKLREMYTPMELPVIVVSALTQNPDMIQALSLGANDYISKPIEPSISILRVRSCLTKSQQAKTITKQLAFQRAVSEATQVLLPGGELGPLMTTITGILLKAADLSRVHVFKNEFNYERELCMSLLSEACAPGLDPHLSLPKLQHASYRKHAPNLQETLTQGKAFQGTLENLPEPEKGGLASLKVQSVLVLPLFRGSEFWGFMSFVDCNKNRLWSSDEVDLLRIVVEATGMFLVRKMSEDEMYRLAVHDGLTGLYNRRYTLDQLQILVRIFPRNKADFTVALIDIDFFKHINDEHGHLAGDMILLEFAQFLQCQFRPNDIVGRYGGEEFVILIQNISMELSLMKFERIRQLIEAETYHFHGTPLKFTFSTGLASTRDLKEGLTSEALINLADTRLYSAKEAGRNRVVGS